MTAMIRVLVVTAQLLTAANAVAQAPVLTPYAGFEERPIKALSAQQVGDLKAGRGMSLALAAELNGFPGPLHVLELSEKLGLTGTQRTAVEGMFAAMKAETIPIGERLIQQETELDQQFATRAITAASLAATMERIGSTQAALRTAHLSYHLAMLSVLTPEQVRRYGALRGYGAANPHRGHH
jgi:Spy/CpxP family protein refolding chaperone